MPRREAGKHAYKNGARILRPHLDPEKKMELSSPIEYSQAAQSASCDGLRVLVSKNQEWYQPLTLAVEQRQRLAAISGSHHERAPSSRPEVRAIFEIKIPSSVNLGLARLTQDVIL